MFPFLHDTLWAVNGSLRYFLSDSDAEAPGIERHLAHTGLPSSCDRTDSISEGINRAPYSPSLNQRGRTPPGVDITFVFQRDAAEPSRISSLALVAGLSFSKKLLTTGPRRSRMLRMRQKTHSALGESLELRRNGVDKSFSAWSCKWPE
jgi:hypothetical protein